MRIALIHPPQPNSIADRLDPPLGILYIAGYIREHGYTDISIADLAGVGGGDVKEAIGEADVYGCTMYTNSYSLCKEIGRITKELNPRSIFVVGGPHPSALPHETAALPWIDAVVVGYGESGFRTLLDRYSGGDRDLGIINVSSLSVDNIPMPAMDLIDLSTYNRVLSGAKSLPLSTRRGCRFSCAFCYKGIDKGVWDLPYSHVSEIVSYYKDCGFERVHVQDSFFTGLSGMWMKYATLFHSQSMRYRCNGRVGVNTAKDIELLLETGCDLLAVGIETGSERLLKRMRKGVTIDDNRRYVSMCRDAGIVLRTYLQFGFPGETRDTMEETMRFVDATDIDQYTSFTHNPFPGTDVYTNCKKYGITRLSRNWDNYYSIAGEDGLGGMPFDTLWLSRSEGLELNREFVSFLRSREWRGSREKYMDRIGI